MLTRTVFGRLIWAGLLAIASGNGCVPSTATTRIVEGTVTCGGLAEEGTVRFVPIRGTPGPASIGYIRTGKYRIDARGGVTIGKHRVEILVQRRTGRKVVGNTGFETGMIDELVAVSPTSYAGEKSPLIVEIKPNQDFVNFDVPPAVR